MCSVRADLQKFSYRVNKPLVVIVAHSLNLPIMTFDPIVQKLNKLIQLIVIVNRTERITRIDVYETLCPQQMLVHKGGKIKNWGGECRDVTPTKSLSQKYQGRCEQRSEVFVKTFFFFFWGGGGQVGGGGGGEGVGGHRVDVNKVFVKIKKKKKLAGSGWGGGGGQGGCERRIEVFVKFKKKNWGGGGRGRGPVWGVRVYVNEDLKFL